VKHTPCQIIRHIHLYIAIFPYSQILVYFTLKIRRQVVESIIDERIEAHFGER